MYYFCSHLIFDTITDDFKNYSLDTMYIKLSFFCWLLFFACNAIHTTPANQLTIADKQQTLPGIQVVDKDGKDCYTIAGKQLPKKYVRHFAAGFAIPPVNALIRRALVNKGKPVPTEVRFMQLTWLSTCAGYSFDLQENKIPSSQEALSFVGGWISGAILACAAEYILKKMI